MTFFNFTLKEECRARLEKYRIGMLGSHSMIGANVSADNRDLSRYLLWFDMVRDTFFLPFFASYFAPFIPRFIISMLPSIFLLFCIFLTLCQLDLKLLCNNSPPSHMNRSLITPSPEVMSSLYQTLIPYYPAYLTRKTNKLNSSPLPQFSSTFFHSQ